MDLNFPFHIYPNKLKSRNFANADGCRFELEKTSPLLDVGAVFSNSKMLPSDKAKTDSSVYLGINPNKLKENCMLMIGQWILLGVVTLLGLILVWNAARYIFKLALVLAVAVLIIYGLHRYALLPEPAQKYIDELFSQDTVQKVKVWIHQECDEEQGEKSTKGSYRNNSYSYGGEKRFRS